MSLLIHLNFHSLHFPQFQDAEFEGLDEKLAAAAWNKNSNAAAASGGQSRDASELLIKKEIKQVRPLTHFNKTDLFFK